MLDPQEITSLEPNEAVELLQRWGNEEQVTNEAATRRICELVGYLPLAVRIAGDFLRSSRMPAEEYVKWLEDSPLDALNHGDRKEKSIQVLLQRSLTNVSEAAQNILILCGVLPFISISQELIQATFPERTIYQPLNELVNYGLFRRIDDRYELRHTLIHSYIRQTYPVHGAIAKCLEIHYTSKMREFEAYYMNEFKPELAAIEHQQEKVLAMLTRLNPEQFSTKENYILLVDKLDNLRRGFIHENDPSKKSELKREIKQIQIDLALIEKELETKSA